LNSSVPLGNFGEGRKQIRSVEDSYSRVSAAPRKSAHKGA
jgi:hypothetical protein